MGVLAREVPRPGRPAVGGWIGFPVARRVTRAMRRAIARSMQAPMAAATGEALLAVSAAMPARRRRRSVARPWAFAGV